MFTEYYFDLWPELMTECSFRGLMLFPPAFNLDRIVLDKIRDFRSGLCFPAVS